LCRKPAAPVDLRSPPRSVGSRQNRNDPPQRNCAAGQATTEPANPLIRSRNALLRLSGRPPQLPASGMRTIWKMSFKDDSWKTPKCVPIGVDGGQRECEFRRRTLPAQLFLRVFRGQCLPPGQSSRRGQTVTLIQVEPASHPVRFTTADRSTRRETRRDLNSNLNWRS
jgi:hypothetical protein